MGFKVRASAEWTVGKMNNLVKSHGPRNINQSVGPIRSDRWGDYEFEAESLRGYLHDCGGTVRVIPTGPRECVVEFVSDRSKCDSDGHTAAIESALLRDLNEHWND